MAAGLYNIVAEQGATYSTRFTYQDSTGTGLDITGTLIRMQVREAPGKTVIVDASTVNAKITITDATNGVFEVTLSNSETEALIPNTYSYDIEVVFNPGGSETVDRILEGKFTVRSEITA